MAKIVTIVLALLIQQALYGCPPSSATIPEAQGIEISEVPNEVMNECSSCQLNDCARTNDYILPYHENTQSEYQLDHLSDNDYSTYKRLLNSSELKARDQDTTLRQVLIIHRHGDRTPINFSPKDSLANEPFWKFHGLGQLTNRGKARVHMLGRLMRTRYNSFLGGSVNKNIRKSRSSGSIRCIESAQGFLSAFLGLDVPDSPDAEALVWGGKSETLGHLWQPASVITMSSSIDGMLNERADCHVSNQDYKLLDSNPAAKKLLVDYKHEVDVMREQYGFEIDSFYKWYWASSFLEVERSYFESKMNPEILKIYDSMQKAGDIALGVYQSSKRLKHLTGGLLINDMLTNMKNFRDSTRPNSSNIDETFVKKFVHYSSHDTNLIVLLGILDSWYKFATRPDYASNVVIELHQDQDEWFVRIFYMPRVPAEPIELHLEACEKAHKKLRCTLDKFENVLEPYKIKDWQSWMKLCENDLSLIDPYKQNT